MKIDSVVPLSVIIDVIMDEIVELQEQVIQEGYKEKRKDELINRINSSYYNSLKNKSV